MLKGKWVAARLFAMLGGAVLAFGFCMAGASAAPLPPPFSNSNYLNGYVCNETADGDLFTALIELHPDGTGLFVSGTMTAPVSNGGGVFDSTLLPKDNFCAFNLDVSKSSYTVDSQGVGVEVLAWVQSSTNSVGCATPFPSTTFMSSDAFVLRGTGIRPSGAVVRTDVTSDNLLGEGEPGDGFCVK